MSLAQRTLRVPHGHLPFGRSESFALPLDAMLGFGAYLDYRF